MPNTIKVKRGKSTALNSSTEKLQAGEVLYNLDKNYLTVGAKDDDALTKKPVAAREIVGYSGDTDSKIGASTNEAYSIKYDGGIKISDNQNNSIQIPSVITAKSTEEYSTDNTVIFNTGDLLAGNDPTIQLVNKNKQETLTLPWKTGTLATTEDITTSASTKLDNTNEDKVALKNNKSLNYTSEATASTVMSRDANGRAKVADGAADQDIATVGQLNTGLNTKVTRPANPTADSVLSILKDGSIGSIPQIKYITLTGTSGTLTADQISTLNENIKYNFIIKETRQAGGYTQSKIFRPIQVYGELDEDVDFVYAHIELDISELIGISGNSWYYSSWKLSKDKVVEISSTDADSGTLTTQQNNDLLDRRTLLLLHGEYYYFIGDLTHAATKIFHSYVSYGKGANDSLQIKIVTIDENASPNTWVRTTYDLGNYYTKTESDGRYYQVTNGTDIPENADLDNYTAPATYQVANDTIAGTIKNSPYKYAFKLIVESFSYYKVQRLQGQNSGYSWQRTRTGGAWNEWVQIATIDYIDNGFVKQTTGHNKVYATDSTGTDSELGYSQSPANSAITQYSSSGTVRTNNPTADLDAVNKQYGEGNYYQLTEGKTVSSSDTIDLNTYKTAGTYNLPASPKTNTPPDVGSATPGKLIVEYLYDNEHIIQSFYSLSNVGKQYRRVFDAMWSDWEEIATTSDIDNNKVFSVTIYEAGD